MTLNLSLFSLLVDNIVNTAFSYTVSYLTLNNLDAKGGDWTSDHCVVWVYEVKPFHSNSADVVLIRAI